MPINIIFGPNFLDEFGFTINYNENILQWLDHEISLKNPDEFLNNDMFIDLNYQLSQHKKGDMFEQEIFNNYATQILDAKYKQVNTNKVAVNQKHLNLNQHHNLQQVFAKYGKLFDGSHGIYPRQKVHIDLLPDLELVHHQEYQVPYAHLQTFTKEP